MGKKIVSITPIGFNPIHKGRVYIADSKIFTPFPEDFFLDSEENPNRWQIEYEVEGDGITKEEIKADLDEETELVVEDTVKNEYEVVADEFGPVIDTDTISKSVKPKTTRKRKPKI